MAESFFNDLGSQFDPKGSGFLSDIVHDDTFKTITQGAGDFFTDTFNNTKNLFGSLSKTVTGIVDNLGGILAGNGFYIILGIAGIGVLAYSYSMIKK